MNTVLDKTREAGFNDSSHGDLPDRPEELFNRLRGELRHLLEDSRDAEAEEASMRRSLTLLRHAQAICWRLVARGGLDAPRVILDQLLSLERFADRHVPDLTPVQRLAVEIRSSTTAFTMAHESLAKLRKTARLRDQKRSASERQILRVLADHPQSYLRRGQVHELLRMRKKPGLARVGQILAQLASEGLLKCVKAPAQGNPETAHYGLSPMGYNIVSVLFEGSNSNLESATSGFTEVDNVDSLRKLFEILISTALEPTVPQDYARIALGILESHAGEIPEEVRPRLMLSINSFIYKQEGPRRALGDRQEMEERRENDLVEYIGKLLGAKQTCSLAAKEISEAAHSEVRNIIDSKIIDSKLNSAHQDDK